MTTAFDAYGRLIHYMILNIVIPSTGHQTSVSFLQMVIMQALHERRKLNFGHLALHILHVGKKDGKYLPYGCLITKVFKFYKLKLEKRTPTGDGSVYNHLFFIRMKFIRIEYRWKMSKICIGNEKEAANSIKETPKSKSEKKP